MGAAITGGQIRPALDKGGGSGVRALVGMAIDREKYSSGTMNQAMYK